MLMQDTAMHAIRLMAVDVANCMSRIAVYQATSEELLELVEMLDQRSWEPVLTDSEEGSESPYGTAVMIPPDQMQAIHRIISVINGLR